MLDYLQKFDKLPTEVKQKISAPAMLAKITQLEKEYGVELAVLIIKIAIKNITLNDLKNRLIAALGPDKTQKLAERLQAEVFKDLADYLGLIKEENALPIKQPTANSVENKENNNQHKSASYFSLTEDEAEVRKLAEKINNYPNIALPKDDLFNQIIKQIKIDFASEILAKRFEEFLKSYLRGIRNRIEIKQAMIKSADVGGLSFDENSVEQILSAVDNILKNPNKLIEPKPLTKIVIPELKKQAIASLKSIGARDFEYDLTTLVKSKQEIKETLKKLDTDHELAPLTPAVVKIVKAIKLIEVIKKPIAPQSILNQKAITEKPKQKIFQENIDLPPKPIIRPITEPESKIKMDDVKFVPRIMSPVDELKYMDLINFRRLDTDATKIVEKIKEKIGLLEKTSYAKRLEGIKAWRSNQINKLYLDIGQTSISLNKPIDAIIEERKKHGNEYLTKQEFEVIMAMNKDLRF